MLALAIMEGHRAIEMYGVDNATNGPCHLERPCNEYLIGHARGRGTAVRISEESSLLKFNLDINFDGEIIHHVERYGYLGQRKN